MISESGSEYSDSEWHDSGRKTVGMYLSGYRRERDANGAPIDDSSFITYLNASADSVQVTLPGAPWGNRYDLVLGSAATDGPATSIAAGGMHTLPPRSATVFRVSE